MQIHTRSEARELGLSTYFTGIPCKNNHLAYRYTQSGTCSGCIRSYSLPNDQFLESRKEAIKERVALDQRISSMIAFGLRIGDNELSFFTQILLQTSRLREPACKMSNCWKGGLGKNRASGTGFHTFRCFAEDLTSLRALADELLKPYYASSAEIELRKAEILRGLQKESESENEWPEGDPR